MLEAPFGEAQIKKFYGWEDRFALDQTPWESLMVVVPAPVGYSFFYDQNQNGVPDPGEQAKGIRVHAKLAEELTVCLRLVADAGLWGFIMSEAGGYNFRQQRGSSKLSMHSLGAAVDFDPKRNPFTRPAETCTLGKEPGLGVVSIFEARDWTWGGRWERPDAMHFQFAKGF